MNMNIFGHDCKDELKKADLKVTPGRLAVIKFLERVKSPADVDTIIEEVGKVEDLDPATIYRILDAFLSKGIVKRIELGEGKYRYEIERHHHHHLICSNCGRIEDIEGEYLKDIENKIRVKRRFQVKSHSLEFFGLCRNCQL